MGANTIMLFGKTANGFISNVLLNIELVLAVDHITEPKAPIGCQPRAGSDWNTANYLGANSKTKQL